MSTRLKKISLDGKWKFCEPGRKKWEDGIVPGCVQLDLMRMGELPDLFKHRTFTHLSFWCIVRYLSPILS